METRASLQSSALGPSAVMGWSFRTRIGNTWIPLCHQCLTIPIRCLLSKVFLCSFPSLPSYSVTQAGVGFPWQLPLLPACVKGSSPLKFPSHFPPSFNTPIRLHLLIFGEALNHAAHPGSDPPPLPPPPDVPTHVIPSGECGVETSGARLLSLILSTHRGEWGLEAHVCVCVGGGWKHMCVGGGEGGVCGFD